MSSGLSSFATFRLSDFVELNCKGIKKQQTQIPSQQPLLSQGIAPKLSTLHYTWQHVPGLVCWLSHCAHMFPQPQQGARCLSLSSLKPSQAWGLGRQRSATCTLGEPKGSCEVPAVAWAQLWLLYRVQGGQSLKKRKEGECLYWVNE